MSADCGMRSVESARGRGRLSSNRRSRGALTLLEVILAITLVMALMGAVISFYQHASSMRSMITQDMQTAASRQRIFDRVDQDLRSALPYSFLGMGLEGKLESDTQLAELRFVTAT